MQLASGFVCDSCGGDVGNAGVTEAATFTALDDAGDVVVMHFCTRKDDTHERCAQRILTAKNQARRVKTNRGKTLTLYRPATQP